MGKAPERPINQTEYNIKEDNMKKTREKVLKYMLEKGKERMATIKATPGDFSIHELMKVIKKIKNGKAAGPDGITTDAIKALDIENKFTLLQTINKIH